MNTKKFPKLRYRLGVMRYNLFYQVKKTVARMTVRLLSPNAYDKSFAGKRILIISPHPDDEVLGCGALIARCVAEGNSPHVVILSGGGASLGIDNPDKDQVVAERVKLTNRALDSLGLPSSFLERLFLEDSRMTQEMDDKEKLAFVIRRIYEMESRPDIILVPSIHDDWPDHRAAHRLGVLLQREYQAHGHYPELWNFCVWTWFYHPLRIIRKVRSSLSLVMSREEYEAKNHALDIYVSPDPATGIFWSGILPPKFVSIHRWNRETYYKEQP